jgi:hypothetical protein
MSTDLSVDRFSTVAAFELVADGRSYRVAQVARDFILLDRATPIPAGPAELIIRVDGEEIRRQIMIVSTGEPKSRRVEIART